MLRVVEAPMNSFAVIILRAISARHVEISNVARLADKNGNVMDVHDGNVPSSPDS